MKFFFKGLNINILFYVIGVLFLIFLFISTLIPNPNIVGGYGKFLGENNFLLFGYISYLIPVYLAYIEYGFFKNISKDFLPKSFSILIVLVNLLIIQSLIFNVGLIGNIFVYAIEPFIGIIGVTFIVLVIFLLGFYMLKLEFNIMDYKISFKIKQDKVKNFREKNKENKKYNINLFKSFFKTKEKNNEEEVQEMDSIIENDESIKELKQDQKHKEDRTEDENKSNKKIEIERYIQSKIGEVYNYSDNLIKKENFNINDNNLNLDNKIKEKEEKEEVEVIKKDHNSNTIKVADSIEKELEKSDEETLRNEDNSNLNLDSEIKEKEEKEEVEVIKIKDYNSNTFKVADSIEKELEKSNEEVLRNKIEKLNRTEVIKEDLKIDDFNSSDLEEIKKVEINNEVKEKIELKDNSREIEFESDKTKNVILINELDENTELLKDIESGSMEKPKDFELPSLELLKEVSRKEVVVDELEIDKKVQLLLNKLRHFKIDGDVVRTYTGPVVTTFEFKPLAHIKVSKILNLQDDLAMALKASTIRIQAPVPGKDVVGIEIPNNDIETIYLREILESDIFKNAKSRLVIALGKDIVGKPFVTDLAKLPHLLIAGTTGSGKSVGINAMILSLLYRNSPDNLRLMMIDPKMLEFSIYNDIPHLLTPVITEPKKAIIGLSNMVKEMERRYKLLSQARVKNIENYNMKYPEDKLPYIVVIIDELADLMMTGGKDVEYSIARLAQMARASGIHLIVATQRPSVDVVTGLIKTNLPSRISFKVGQKIDSKVILDQLGAESLLGRGDMLFTPGSGTLIRLHAPFTTEEEIENIVEFLKSQREVSYDESFLGESVSELDSDNLQNKDELFEDAKEIILNEGKTSISYLQRRLQIGYNRAANIIEQLEATGFLSAKNAKGQREILG